jgi:hypothetical protein
MIYTKRHEVSDLFLNSEPAGDPELFFMVGALFDAPSLPHYVLTPELMKSLDSQAVSDTCTAMCQAGVANMPHREMLVETKCGHLSLFTLFRQEDDGVYSLLLTYDGQHVELIPQTMIINMHPDGTLERRNSPSKDIGDRICATYLVTLVLSHTRGLAKEFVTAESVRKLNKARVAKKRAPIQEHVVLRVGRVYQKNGTAYKHTEGVTPRRPHLRKGHARKQKYGPNWSQERWIFVPPVFVNWEEGDDVPLFKTKVVMP